ncbi:GAF domain-containing protein [uncultured Chitinophaga sp.]|mgnify:CR=1 FL=1|jgi:hypothetical protein|uniref:GAF domain-containing protein n=1 Tax=uncultured Chitinophaga sp. TaxID=339340 RepID=UPI002608F3AF|nr:GAF domain-containing protein [uncultured Chitinophaga sp.]
MNLHSFADSPFQIALCFYTVIEHLEKVAADPSNEGAARAQALLQDVAPYPELRNGITDMAQLEQHAGLIRRLLADYFPAALTLNEIKAVALPYEALIFNHTERFKNILRDAGPGFSINIRDLDVDQAYIASCCIILNEFYGTRLDFTQPLFYDIPTAEGIIKHYRILYNADFMDIYPTERSVVLTREDIDLLLNSYDNITLWREKFPPQSWLLKGFTLMSLYDATVENAVSALKGKLLSVQADNLENSIENIFRSIFRMPDIQVGLTVLDEEEGTLRTDGLGRRMRSFILQEDNNVSPAEVLCNNAYRCLLKKRGYFAVADTTEYLAANPDSLMATRLLSQNVNSFILAPVVKNQQLFGVLEVVSAVPKALNSINANKLDVVMPYLTDNIERLVAEWHNQIQAVIQDRYTAIHRSVYWKFRQEAKKLIAALQEGSQVSLSEIVFPDVYPLYGQIDIKGSSDARNDSIRKDLRKQLHAVSALLEALPSGMLEAEKPLLEEHMRELAQPLRADTEQLLTHYLDNHIQLLLKPFSGDHQVDEYFREADKEKGAFHAQRRKFEQTISEINGNLAAVIDRRQKSAQGIFPHYYERFKTDGVEHNLYIGASISPRGGFDLEKLQAIRLWQLEVLCAMDAAHRSIKAALPIPLDVTALILVYHATIAIRFRMDEKRFDVDGSYNARFEIVKKRIDKAHVKDSIERIVQAGALTIVYSSHAEEEEYLQYVRILQSRGKLDSRVEHLEVEDLQGVSGLRALRVKITAV